MKLKKALKNMDTKYSTLLIESDKNWEMVDIVPMKFNRLVFYPTDLFHSGYIKKDSFLHHDRITQTGFF